MARRCAVLALAMAAAVATAQIVEDSTVLDVVAEATCESTADCHAQGLDDWVCRAGVCEEDEPLFPLSHTELVGSIGAFVCTVLSAGSGLGGGGLLVPAYIILMSLSSHEAVPLSKATIFGGAIASFMLNIGKRHPLVRSRPIIDYETVLLMEPMTLAGTIVGVNMNAVFPEWLITVCIVWLLTKTAVRTFSKGKKIWKEETHADRKKVEDIVNYWKLLPYESRFKKFQLVALAYLKWKAYKRAVGDAPELKLKVLDNVAFTDVDEHGGSSSTSTDDDSGSDNDNESESLIHSVNTSNFMKTIRGKGKKSSSHRKPQPLRPLSLEEMVKSRRVVPLTDLFVLCLTWTGLVVFSLAKGGHGTPSIVGVSCGSVGYWSLVALAFPFFVVVTMYYGHKISRFHDRLQASGFEYAKGDVVWTKKAVVKYPAFCTAAGVAAGLLGIGGGMVKGPLLLEMGLHPQVAAATSSSMILFTSSATTVQFIILGTLTVEHALWHGAIGFVSGLVGQIGMSYLIRKYRKSAFVIFLIAFVIGFSGIIMGFLGVERLSEIGVGGFRSLCAV